MNDCLSQDDRRCVVTHSVNRLTVRDRNLESKHDFWRNFETALNKRARFHYDMTGPKGSDNEASDISSASNCSRRRFLGLIALASAAVAGSASKIVDATSLSLPSSPMFQGAQSTLSTGKDPMILVIDREKVVAFQGLREFTVNDGLLAAEFESKLKSRMQ